MKRGRSVPPIDRRTPDPTPQRRRASPAISATTGSSLPASTALHLTIAAQFLREMAQPTEMSQVSLDLGDLERDASYVAHGAQVGITQHPMQGDGGETLGRGDQQPQTIEPEPRMPLAAGPDEPMDTN